MKTVEIAKATKTLAECARGVGSDPLVVTEEGKPVAVLLPLENADIETVSLSIDQHFLALTEHSRSRLAEEGGLSSEEVRRRLGIEK
jgi:PHD/YefM family antitoxin component YafN of YafNO toxin-antitoxin module